MANIEYFYSAHSGFAYLGSARFMEIAAADGREIVHKPFDLYVAMEAVDAKSFRDRNPALRSYMFREIQRWSEYRGAPVMDGRPTYHDNDTALSNCMLVAGVMRGENIDRLAHVLLEAHWRDDADLADRGTLLALGNSVGMDAEALLTEAETQEVRSQFQINTREAVERGVFGSPTYFVDGERYFGQDRLEIIEHALKHPFSRAPQS
ncbi:MAG: 2-hydroxychromene-2-carboxylate isomerase [Rhodospirillaceae bacterium]|nr:2-hydroxychromene-2-carboxylate isomerase [Rhodospirillaceae bacterium]